MENTDLVNFTQDLIRIPSTTGHETEIIDRIIFEMDRLNFDETGIDPAGNAVGKISGIAPGETVLLDAHADTVGVQTDIWTQNPFSGAIINNRIYGRGAVDTKGNLAAMIYGAADVDRHKIHGSIVVSATVSEEVMEGGSIQTVIAESHPDFVIIGEATELNINRGGRGRAEIVIETTGKSAHSSSPEVGLCAVHEMMKLITVIDKRPLTIHPLLGPDSMVLTDIISKPYPGSSVIPNSCRATYDRRLLTGESQENLFTEIHNLALEAGVSCKISIVESAEETYTGLKLAGFKFLPAWLTPEDHPLVQKAVTAIRKTNPGSKVGAYRFCTNAAYTAGIARIPTIGFGLGKESEAHTDDESLSIDELVQASQGYRDIIHSLLGS